MGRVTGGNLRRSTYLHRDEERKNIKVGIYWLVAEWITYLTLSFVSLHVNEQQPITSSSSAMMTKT